MGKRRQSREAALKLLYAIDMTHEAVQDVVRAPWVDQVMSDNVRAFTTKLVAGVLKHRDDIDMSIQEYSTNWSLERIGLVERNILRFAIYELCFLPDIPPNVTINEAVEVAKKYGTDEAPAFINGILDRVKHVVEQRHEGVVVASGV